MPPGWRVDNSSSSGGLGGSRCLAGLTTTTHHTSQAAAEFEYGAGLPFVGETLGSGKQEVSDFAKVSARLAGCKTLKLTANGATYPGTIGALSFPTVGTKSSAYLITFAIKGVTAGIDLIVFTTASYVGTLTYGDVGTPDVSQVEAFASLALAKLRGSPLPSLPTPTTAPHSVA